MTSVTISAPAELYGNFSKTNLRRADVRTLGVGWEFSDMYCEKCGANRASNVKMANNLRYRIALSVIADLGGPAGEIAKQALEKVEAEDKADLLNQAK
jgi:hypothetical protein